MKKLFDKQPLSAKSVAEQVGRQVRHLRERLGLTVPELSERSGIHWATLQEVERGNRVLLLWEIFRVAEALEVPAPRLLENAPPPPEPRTPIQTAWGTVP